MHENAMFTSKHVDQDEPMFGYLLFPDVKGEHDSSISSGELVRVICTTCDVRPAVVVWDAGIDSCWECSECMNESTRSSDMTTTVLLENA